MGGSVLDHFGKEHPRLVSLSMDWRDLLAVQGNLKLKPQKWKRTQKSRDLFPTVGG